MSVQLFAHNMQAYLAVSEMLEKTSKAAVIHPTGTGKSYGLKLGIWVCKQRSLWKTGKKTSADMRQYRLLESIGLFADQETRLNA